MFIEFPVGGVIFFTPPRLQNRRIYYCGVMVLNILFWPSVSSSHVKTHPGKSKKNKNQLISFVFLIIFCCNASIFKNLFVFISYPFGCGFFLAEYQPV